jgi:hypothetical protein
VTGSELLLGLMKTAISRLPVQSDAMTRSVTMSLLERNTAHDLHPAFAKPVLGARPRIRPCSRMVPGFRWILAFSATT